MPLHVELGGRKNFSHLVALVEVLGALDLVAQLLRHRRTGFVVARIVIEDLGISAQCSLNCDGNSTKSRGRRGSREARIPRIREHAVQRVAELMEQRDHVVEADERRRARRGLARLATLKTTGRVPAASTD